MVGATLLLIEGDLSGFIGVSGRSAGDSATADAKKRLAGPVRSQVKPDAANASYNTGPDFEQLDSDCFNAGLGQLGICQCDTTEIGNQQ